MHLEGCEFIVFFIFNLEAVVHVYDLPSVLSDKVAIGIAALDQISMVLLLQVTRDRLKTTVTLEKFLDLDDVL